jgi:hypothetical protein
VVLQIHAWPVHTPEAPLEGGHVGYTVPCTIDNLVAFGLDLLPLLSEAAMLWGHMWEGGESHSSRRAICPNPHPPRQSNTVISRPVSTAPFLSKTRNVRMP